MVEYADDGRTELERKAEQLKWVAALETLSYVLLFLFWMILDNLVGTKLMGFFHGWIFLAFAAMVIFIARPMHWSWKFVLVALFTGPIGSVLVYERIRRDGVPPTNTGALKLSVAHKFKASAKTVCDGMGDPAFYAGLRLPDVQLPEVITRTGDDYRVSIYVRFTYTGRLDPLARRIVGSDHVSWVQQLEINRTALESSLKVVPAAGVVPVSCSGKFVLQDLDGGGCIRNLSGDLRIKVPIIGSRAEKSLAPGILSRIDLEAAALDAYLAG